MELLNDVLHRIAPQDAACRAAAVDHILHLTMPRWALGRLLDLAVDLAGLPRLQGARVDAGCYECQFMKATLLLFR